jgi:hypothetical protein
MAGLVPAIHVFVFPRIKTWMPATSAGMTISNHGVRECVPGTLRRLEIAWRLQEIAATAA